MEKVKKAIKTIGGYGVFQALLIALKLHGIIDWSWWFVLVPLEFIIVFDLWLGFITLVMYKKK